MLTSSLAEARGDATAKCQEVEDLSNAYAYQTEKLMHAMRQAAGQTEAAAAAHAEAMHCQDQIRLQQLERADLTQALTSMKTSCRNLRTALSPLLQDRKGEASDGQAAAGEEDLAEQLSTRRSGSPVRTGILISEAQEAVADVAGLVRQLDQQRQAHELAKDAGMHDQDMQPLAALHAVQSELEGKSLAFTAQGHRLAAAQEQVQQLTADLQQVHSQLSLKEQHLEQLTTDHILEAERVGQACSEAAVMAQQIDALLAAAAVRNLELAEARADASALGDQLQMWRQQASNEQARVSPAQCLQWCMQCARSGCPGPCSASGQFSKCINCVASVGHAKSALDLLGLVAGPWSGASGQWLVNDCTRTNSAC